MAVNKQSLPTQEYTLNFGSFQFFDGYVISTINEGVELDEEKLLQFYSLCSNVFEDKPFSVIELRAFSFSMDPSFYLKYSDLLSNITAHAMVVVQNTRVKLSQCEVLCIKHCPCKTFYSVSDAVSWVSLV